MDPGAVCRGMTQDRRRDLEAHAHVIVARYCAECGRAIPIEDGRNEARDWEAHVARHRHGRGQGAE